MTEGNIIEVWDDLVDLAVGTHTYIIEDILETVNIQGAVPVDANVEYITSKRDEGCTVLSIMVVKKAIAIFYNIPWATITLTCNNQEALQHQTRIKLYVKWMKSESNIKTKVQKVIKLLPVIYIFAYGKDHEDNSKLFCYNEATQLVKKILIWM